MGYNIRCIILLPQLIHKEYLKILSLSILALCKCVKLETICVLMSQLNGSTQPAYFQNGECHALV